MLSAWSVWLAPLFGVLIGLALGMLGGGGSILTVPVLVYILGQSPHSAVATSLVIVGANAVFGAFMHARAGRVKLKQALLFGVIGIPAAFVGARISQYLSETLLLVLFAILMLIIAGNMLRPSKQPTSNSQHAIVWWKVALGGLGVGFLTGFLGVGGGFLIVPALVLLLGMDMKDAVGSSLVVIAINSASGLLGHISSASLPWDLIGLFVLSGVLGLFAGMQISKRISATQLRQSFAVFVIALALVLLFLNAPAILQNGALLAI